jgi:hypothetical protein
MLIARGPDDIVMYVGEGKLLMRSITEGDRVTLRSGDQSVLVRDVSIVAPGEFSGVIYGFEPSHATEVNGLQLEQRVAFNESHVFGCIST